jgi:uncharacterized protein YjgD (DUF1641 family)
MANDTPQVPPALDKATVNSLVELVNLQASASDAISDEMVTRLARAMSEAIALVDRLTRNEGLMRLLQVLERPEMQHHLMSLGDALPAMSRDLALAPPAKSGITGLFRLARQPGTQEGLRALSILGQYWGESLRELHRTGGR